MMKDWRDASLFYVSNEPRFRVNTNPRQTYTISLSSSMMYIRQMQILVQAQICTWLIVYTKRPELAPLPGAFWSFSFHCRTFFLSTALYSSIRKLSCSIPFPVSRSFSFNSSKSGTFTFSSFSIVSFEIVFAYSSYFS